jgi:hypothetical protein
VNRFHLKARQFERIQYPAPGPEGAVGNEPTFVITGKPPGDNDRMRVCADFVSPCNEQVDEGRHLRHGEEVLADEPGKDTGQLAWLSDVQNSLEVWSR